MSKIKNINLEKKGTDAISFAKEHMFILEKIEEDFKKTKPFKNIKISVALHLEKKTAMLLKTLKKGGAKISVASCNPLSTDDSVAASISKEMDVYAWSDQTQEEYFWCIEKVLDISPNIIIDDGCDLVNLIHEKRPELIENIYGGCEETTTGIKRLKKMQENNKLKFPIINVNDAYSKHLFDNRFGTGQSTLSSIMAITNLNLAGKKIVVFGFGFCGKGICEKLRGIGARVIVVEAFDEIDNFGVSGVHKALEAHMLGYEVKNSIDACKDAEIIITATGCDFVVNKKEIDVLKDKTFLANAGHFDNEINLKYLKENTVKIKKINENLEEYILKDKRKIYLMSQGRLVNLARPIGQGHPIEIMDLSFGIQALSCKYLLDNKDKNLENKVLKVPNKIDMQVSKLFFKKNENF